MAEGLACIKNGEHERLANLHAPLPAFLRDAVSSVLLILSWPSLCAWERKEQLLFAALPPLAVPVATASEVNGLAFALERGVDAIVVSAPLQSANDDGAALAEAQQAF